MTSRRVRLSWLAVLLLAALAVWWRPLPARAAAIELDQISTMIIGRVGQGISVDPGSWAAVWMSTPDRPVCGPDIFQPLTAETLASFSQTEADQAQLPIPLAANNQFVCFRAESLAGDWLYSDWFAVRVQAAELSIDQRHQFVTVTASQPVVSDSWRGTIVADCPDSAAIDRSLSAEVVRLSSDLQLVLELDGAVDNQWLCVVATDRNWATTVFGRHRLSRLDEPSPVVSIDRSGNRLRASADPAQADDDWRFFKSFDQPNCRANPIPESGRVADPPSGDWLEGRQSTIDRVDDNDKIWVCFIVMSQPDEFGNRLTGYGLHELANRPPPTFRGLFWLLALNVFIICAGAAVGILVYRTQPN